ncbi:MAG: STAS domain-containing protein [Candidatus Solibacter sp.]|nr:STAS domain-containing protein [Candidatus Solibacter sp.]
MLLEITEREMPPDITVVELTGKLAMGRECQRVETVVDDLAKRGSTRVIFDMSGVDYMDSAGIGMLALATGKLKESGGSLAIVAPEGRVLQLLNLTQLTAIVKVCPTLDAAAAAL